MAAHSRQVPGSQPFLPPPFQAVPTGRVYRRVKTLSIVFYVPYLALMLGTANIGAQDIVAGVLREICSCEVGDIWACIVRLGT